MRKVPSIVSRCVGLFKSMEQLIDNENQEWICRPCAHLSSNQLKSAVNLCKSINDYIQYLQCNAKNILRILNFKNLFFIFILDL